MRLTFELGPLNLDCTLTLGASDEPDASALNGGTLGGTVVAGPAEVPWEDAGSLHQFEAPEDRRVGFR